MTLAKKPSPSSAGSTCLQYSDIKWKTKTKTKKQKKQKKNRWLFYDTKQSWVADKLFSMDQIDLFASYFS